MDIFNIFDDYGDNLDKKIAAQQLEKLYDMLNSNSKDVKLLKEFSEHTNRMDVVTYNQQMYDELQGNGWDLNMLQGKFIRQKSSLK